MIQKQKKKRSAINSFILNGALLFGVLLLFTQIVLTKPIKIVMYHEIDCTVKLVEWQFALAKVKLYRCTIF